MLRLRRLHDLVEARTAPHGLALVRIIIGTALILRAIEGGHIIAGVVAPSNIRVPYGFGAAPMTPDFVLFFQALWLVSAAAFTIGFLTRLNGAVLTAILTYTLFIDQQTYSNHLFLLAIIALLLTVGDSGAAYSVDARGGRPVRIHAWPVFLLKVQLSFVYGFTALAKMNATYLSGLVFLHTIRQTSLIPFPVSLRTAPVLAAIAAASVALELWLAFALWNPRWRRHAVVLGVVFHAFMVLLMRAAEATQLFVFAVSTMSLYLLFFDHDPTPVKLYVGGRCRACARIVSWVRRADRMSLVQTIESDAGVAPEHGLRPAHAYIVLEGARVAGVQALAQMCRSLPLGYQPFRLLALPGVGAVADSFGRRAFAHQYGSGRADGSSWEDVRPPVPESRS